MKYAEIVDQSAMSQPISREHWLMRTMILEPARIFDAAERDAFVAKYWSGHPRLEAQQWRRSGSKQAAI